MNVSLRSVNGEVNGGIEGYEDDFKKAIDLLEQNHKRVPDSFLHIPLVINTQVLINTSGYSMVFATFRYKSGNIMYVP